MLHGLYWLCANLASGPPLHIVVDDAHRADAPSLRYLAFLLPRLEQPRWRSPWPPAPTYRPTVGGCSKRSPVLDVADILDPGRPLRFVHPMVRAGIYEGLSTGQVLGGFAPQPGCSGPLSDENERVAEHLLASEPAADAWSVDRLVEAARAAVGVRLDRNLSRFHRSHLPARP